MDKIKTPWDFSTTELPNQQTKHCFHVCVILDFLFYVNFRRQGIKTVWENTLHVKLVKGSLLIFPINQNSVWLKANSFIGQHQLQNKNKLGGILHFDFHVNVTYIDRFEVQNRKNQNAMRKHLEHLENDCMFFPQTIHFAPSFSSQLKLTTSFKYGLLSQPLLQYSWINQK